MTRKITPRPLTMLLVGFALMMAGRLAPAADVAWSTCSSGLFDDTTCWTGGVLPGTGDNVILNGMPASFTVRWDGSTLGNWNAATGNALAAVTNVDLMIGNSGNVTMLSDPGTGQHPYNLTGDIAINGGSTLNLGAADAGTADPIQVSLGGRADVGSGSGPNATGTLNVRGGSELMTTTTSFLGQLSGSHGTATVSGAGSTWTNASTFEIARLGTGSLTIEDGGAFTNTSAYLARLGGSGTATVTGIGSTWTNNGLLRIGWQGSGSLAITSGGFVASENGEIGATFGHGTVTVGDGVGISRWTVVGDLAIGGTVSTAGTGAPSTLTINGGGDVTVSGALRTWNTGTFNLAGGAISAGSIDVSRGTFNFTGGAAYATDSVIGYVNNSTGVAMITGPGSQWIISASLLVGEFGDGSLNILDGATVSNGMARVGGQAGGVGVVDVSGEGSSWISTTDLEVGQFGTGTLNVSDSGVVVNAAGWIGRELGGSGSVTIDGTGSQWNNTGELFVGESGNGALHILDGAIVTNGLARIGGQAGGVGEVHVDGTDSAWTSTDNIGIGSFGDGLLTITGGGSASNLLHARIGLWAGGVGVVEVSGEGSSWSNGTDLEVGQFGTGTLNVSDGGAVSNAVGWIGQELGGIGAVNVSGANSVSGTASTWVNSSELIVGHDGTGELNILDGGFVSNTLGHIGRNTAGVGTVTVSGVNTDDPTQRSHWENGAVLFVGGDGFGTLNVLDGALVTNTTGIVGFAGSATGVVNVSGAGSQWHNSDALTVGGSGNGTVNIGAGGSVMSNVGFISRDAGTGLVTLAGTGATWNTNSLYVGGSDSASGGTGVLNISAGGTVNVADNVTIWDDGTVNLNGGTLNVANVVMAGSTFNFNGGVLAFGGDFQFATGEVLGASFTLLPGRELKVSGTTTIDPFGGLTLAGGTFSTGDLAGADGFVHSGGTFKLTNANLVLGVNGLFGDTLQLASNQKTIVSLETIIESDGLLVVDNDALTSMNYTNNGEIILTRTTARLKGASLDNAGLLHGEGRVETTLTNQADGEVRARSGERLVFTGANNTNAGEINLLDATAEFTHGLTNEAGGFIGGRGVLSTDAGLDNRGVIAFTGTSDIFGDVVNTGAGRILASGGSTLTFYDDVVHDGAELRASAGSSLVFLGAFSGSGGGLAGDFFLEGDLRPGDSPGLLGIDGNVTLGTLNTLEIELGGLARGTEYDALDVSGTLVLGGTLNVVLYNPGGGLFAPQFGDTFDIFAAGLISGAFADINLPGLAAGLFWNTAELQTFGTLSVAAVPLPATMWLLLSALVGVGALGRRCNGLD